MKINIIQKNNENLNKDEVNIEIQHSNQNTHLQHFINYINEYNVNFDNKVIVLDDNYTLLEVNCKDIITFYSNKKYNYCKLKNKSYRIKSKLYEIEKVNDDFIRISKSCIVNMKHVEKFDIGETGKIIVKLDDLSEEIVSRRKTKEIMKYLEERRI